MAESTTAPGTPAPRKNLSRRLRYEILRRDNHTCRYCGAAAPDAKLTVDHVLPVALGGTDDPTNLAAACHDCNAGKSSTRPDDAMVAQVTEDAMRWSEAVKMVAAQMRAESHLRELQVDQLMERWFSLWQIEGWTAKGYEPPEEESLDAWLKRGLTADDIGPLMDLVVSRWRSGKVNQWTAWRYLAGCCWRRISDIEAAAREVLSEQQES